MSFLSSLRGSLLSAAIGALITFGCTSDPGAPDGGIAIPDGATTPTAVLEVVGDLNLALLFGEEAAVRVLYREADGRPISGQTVELALVGRANDSSLRDLSATTAADGEAGFRVVAGTSASAFSVRVSAPRAAPVLIGVSVSDAGFGGLSTTIEWVGARLIDARRVAVFTGMSCADDDVLLGEADREKTLLAGEDAADFPALPAGLVYAVTATGLGATGDAVAWGCVDDVLIEADVDTEATLTMVDLPLDSTGVYSVLIDLDAATALEAISRAITRGGRAPIEGAGGDAAFLLDLVEAYLRDAGDAAAADVIAAERVSAFLDDALGTSLGADASGPSRAVDTLAETLTTRMARIAIGGRVTLSETDPAFAVTDITANSVDGSSPPLVANLTAFGAPPTGRLSFTPMPAEDTLGIDEIGADLPLGDVALGVTSALIIESGADDLGMLLEARGGCVTFSTWTAMQPSIDVACDDVCVFSICQAALETIAAQIESEVATLDLLRSDLSLTGIVDASDDSGDLTIDVFSADALTGRYRNADGSDYDDVTAALRAARIIE